MKFTVELEEFWLDEEELSSTLTSVIKRDVISQVSKSIEDKVEKQITEKVTECINEKLNPLIDNTLSDLIATGTLTINRQEITTVEHIKNLFMKNSGWNNPTRQMESIAKKFGEELKLQYNNMFATKIVDNMKKQGLLKDEVVQILLTGDKE